MIKYTKTTTIYISDENEPLIEVVAKNRGYVKETSSDTAQEYIISGDNNKQFQETVSEIKSALYRYFGESQQGIIDDLVQKLENGAIVVDSKFEVLENNE